MLKKTYFSWVESYEIAVSISQKCLNIQFYMVGPNSVVRMPILLTSEF